MVVAWPQPRACDACGKQYEAQKAHAKFCSKRCRQKNARCLEGKRVAELTRQLAAAQERVRTLTAEVEVLRNPDPARREPMGGVETTLQAMLRHKAAEHGGDLASACTAISEAFLNVLQLAVGALAQCTEVNVPRSLAALKRALEPTGPQAHGPPAMLAASPGFAQGRHSVAAPSATVLSMRRTLTEVLSPAIDKFVLAGERLGFASVESSVTPLKWYILSASPMRPDANFTFDIYVSVLAYTVQLLVEFGARAHEYTALALNMAYHIEHNLMWDKAGERTGDKYAAESRRVAKEMLLEARDTPSAPKVASSVRHVLNLTQATRHSFKTVLERVEPELDANTVVVISATTCKEGFKTQLAKEHVGQLARVSTFGDQVVHLGSYFDGVDGLCTVDEVTGKYLAECALVPIVRAARIGATLRILHVGCFSSQSFLAPLAQLISSVRRGRGPPPQGAVDAAMGVAALPDLLSDDALRRVHVVVTTDAVPGDAVVEILVNFARYAGSGSLDEFWVKLMDKLKRSAGYYEHYGIEDPGLSQQDITTMIEMECLADSVAAVP